GSARGGRAHVQRHARADPADREPVAQEAPEPPRSPEAERRHRDRFRLCTGQARAPNLDAEGCQNPAARQYSCTRPPLLAPARALAREPERELMSLGADRRTARAAAAGGGPVPPHELAVQRS